MKKFTVSFKRKAVYEEDGYITVEASSASAAKRIAIEMLEDGKDPCDYEGDVSDIIFVQDSPLPEPEVEITSVDKDDIADDYEVSEYDDGDDYYEDDEYDDFVD